MGALISRCLKWRSDPDPISSQHLCASANNPRSCNQRQQKKVPQSRSCAASGPQRLLDSRKFHQRPGLLQGIHLTGSDPTTPPSPRSKDAGFTGSCSASPANDRPPTPKFLIGRQQIKSPDGSTNAAYGSCSFSFPQQHQQQMNSGQASNPYCGDLRHPQQQAQQQQALPRHLQEDEEVGSRVKRTLSLRLSTRNCDTAATPRKARSIRSKGNARPRDN